MPYNYCDDNHNALQIYQGKGESGSEAGSGANVSEGLIMIDINN